MENKIRLSKSVKFDAIVYMNSYTRNYVRDYLQNRQLEESPDELIKTNEWEVSIQWPKCIKVINYPMRQSGLPMYPVVPRFLAYNGSRLVELSGSYYDEQTVSDPLDRLTTAFSPFLVPDIFFADDFLKDFTAIKSGPMQRFASSIYRTKDTAISRSCDLYVKETSDEFPRETRVYVDRRTHLISRYSTFYGSIEDIRIDFVDWNLTQTLAPESFEAVIPGGLLSRQELVDRYEQSGA
jgi:hypothetical protein